MHPNAHPHGRRAAPLAALTAVVLAAACGGDGGAAAVGGVARDAEAPRVRLDTASGGADSVLAFSVVASDNLDLQQLRLSLVGGVTAQKDTTLAVGTKAASMTFRFPVAAGVAPGTPVTLAVQVTDGAGNVARMQSTLAIGNFPVSTVAVTAPAAGTAFVIGKSGTLKLVGRSPIPVRWIGWEATSGSLTVRDSAPVAASAARDSVVVVDTLAIPAGTAAGTLSITPFLVDSASQRTVGRVAQYPVQTTPTSTGAPTVEVTSGSRLELADPLEVSASDPSGISRIGYELLDSSDAVVAGDSVTTDGSLTSLARSLPVRNTSGRPLPLRLRTFAVGTSGQRGTARLGTVARLDTVVSGATRPLPFGGRVADGLYHPRHDRLYLTNIERNTLDVFDMARMTFEPAVITVGSRPWGIAAWPRDRSGTMGDTLLVANSGATDVSYVDLVGRREVVRYPLPNLIAYTVTTEKSSETGAPLRVRRVYDFSDRPQFLATTCSGPAGAAACGDPILVYSTSPTGGQTMPFPNKGTVRWENLARQSSHFFFEHALGQAVGRSDTLEIERFAAAGNGLNAHLRGRDSVLVPSIQPLLSGGAPAGFFSIVVRIADLGLRDTTFVRNSGNFRRAMLGEGGAVLGSRALMYDASVGMQGQAWGQDLTLPVIDGGVSRPGDVTDVVANTFSQVRGVALNWDGSLGAIRADSTYLVDPTLRLQGVLASGGSNAGFDFHPENRGAASTLATRLAFSASSRAQLEVYDTWCFRNVATILLRDPIIGPVKVSVRDGGRQLVVVGATARGVIVVPIAQDQLRTSCT